MYLTFLSFVINSMERSDQECVKFANSRLELRSCQQRILYLDIDETLCMTKKYRYIFKYLNSTKQGLVNKDYPHR